LFWSKRQKCHNILLQFTNCKMCNIFFSFLRDIDGKWEGSITLFSH
jgi:hypothetical protein